MESNPHTSLDMTVSKASVTSFSAGSLLVCLTVASVGSLGGQDANPRFGRWLLDSDRPAPSLNVMTYEAYGDGGMRVTVTSTNSAGETTEWGYVTMFVDGEYHPVTGLENSDTAVELVDEYTNRIINRRNGRPYQVIINTLSEDGNTIENEYVRLDDQGRITRVGHATYRRIIEDRAGES